MKTATVTTRLDPQVKAEAEATLASLGLTLSQAMNLFLYRVVAVGGLPFKLRQPQPNPITRTALDEGKAILEGRVAAQSYSSFADLLADLEDD